jgi:hypothetical protein
MGIPPMIAVRRDFGRYSDRTSKSEAVLSSDKKECTALDPSVGVSVQTEHGRDAHGTTQPTRQAANVTCTISHWHPDRIQAIFMPEVIRYSNI